jgi:methyl-accepting chemotaxis protein
VQSIAAAAEQQSAASEEISRTVESIDKLSGESARGVEQSAVAATQLSRKAEHLRGLVERFKLAT